MGTFFLEMKHFENQSHQKMSVIKVVYHVHPRAQILIGL